MFKELPLKSVYRTEEDNILEDFYIPALKSAVSYDRAVGFFSSAMLSYASQGLSAFVKREGKMRLIVGGELEEDEIKAIDEGYELKRIAQRIGDKYTRIIDDVAEALSRTRLETLSWLIASGRLDIKVVLKKKGMYHEKIGILTDEDGDQIVFQGSANETVYALLPDFNFESINVFQCWRPELEDHFSPHIVAFEKLWDNRARNALVIDFPDAPKERLVKISKSVRPLTPEIEHDLWNELLCRHDKTEPEQSAPFIPSSLNGQPFGIMDHQRRALNAWRSHEFRGILAHATGAGKTITSIYGAVKIFEKSKKMFLLISVPYQNLADQWVDTLGLFNISAIRCYSSSTKWLSKLSECVTLYQTNALKFVCAVVVNRTLQGELFQSIIQQVPGDQMLFVGDECHHHSSENLAKALPNQAEWRLGLSATPSHYLNEELTQRLIDYYGSIADKYDLEDALKDGVLTPYRYHVELVELTEEEAEKYAELSEKISRLAAQKGVSGESASDPQLSNLLFKRARLLGSASNKLDRLKELLQKNPPNPYTLFYCGDGSTEDEDTGESMRQIESTSQILRGFGWKPAHFTSRESRDERQAILENFKIGFIDAMVAIRCLDEGVDVPACRTAYILASARNPKQFIQRRGRILRRSPGKEFAEIYDFVVHIGEVHAEGRSFERQLIAAELARVAEFSNLSLNPGETLETLNPLLEHYDLLHHLV